MIHLIFGGAEERTSIEDYINGTPMGFTGQKDTGIQKENEKGEDGCSLDQMLE